jgi:hypothetical protein
MHRTLPRYGQREWVSKWWDWKHRSSNCLWKNMLMPMTLALLDQAIAESSQVVDAAPDGECLPGKQPGDLQKIFDEQLQAVNWYELRIFH